ncbi:MAG: NYN domain-containing protein [Polyangiales bacterium]
MSDTAAWFIDGAYLFKVWQSLHRQDRLDYLKLRVYLESTFQSPIDEAYYFSADPDPPTAGVDAFHHALAYPPPHGPGLRVKLYWLQRRALHWPAAWGGGPIVHPKTGQHYELVQQKAVDVGLAFHLMRSHGTRKWRKLFLAAGDSDFHEAVQHLVENEGVELVLVGSLDTMSHELMPYARTIVQLVDVADQLVRGA